MKESVVSEHLNLNIVQKLIFFNNTMLLKVSGKCTSFEVKAAHRNQKAQISFAELGKVGVGHRLDNGNPPSESTQSRKRY